ncbi:MAG: outer membrane protein transport protein [Deltaproteobacteria bacterium]|nr:outer membrane protein transport protein [Deltaproteobacteria bacterium]
MTATLVTVALLGLPAGVQANPFELYGASARSGGLGQAVTAGVRDWSSLWYNPGGLTQSAPHIDMGTLMSFDDVRVRLKERPAGYNVPDLGSASPAIPSNYRLQARKGSDDVSNLYDFVMGATGSFGFENLRIGVAVALPMTRLGQQVSHYADEREQYASNQLNFELYGDRSQHQVILVGAGYQVLSWLSLGAAISVMPEGTAHSTVYLEDAARQQDVRISVQNQQIGRAAPIIGAIATPIEHLRFGLSWRSANYFALTLKNAIQIRGFQGDAQSFPVQQNVVLRLNSSPDQLAAGVAGELGAWALSADAVLSRWSQYVDTQNQLAGFRDTVSLRLGAELQAARERQLRLGVQWEPSPVPAQTGRTSYVDNDRIVATVGMAHALELFKKQVTLSWYLGLHHLLARDTNKTALAHYPVCAPGVTSLCDEVPDTATDPATGQPAPAAVGLQTGSPGFPGWTSSGNLLALGMNLQWGF